MSWRVGTILSLTLALMALLAPSKALALHDQGYPCYQCHSLKPTELRPLSRAIRLDEGILASIPTFPVRTNLPLPGTNGYPVSCDFCHRAASDIPTQNMASKPKRHPVDLIQIGDANPTNEITCNDCHNGGAQDLTPATLLTKTTTDGYPDHKNVDNVYIHNLTNNPPHLTQAYWGATLPGVSRATDTTFWTNVQGGSQSILCWQCHDGVSVSPFTQVKSTKVIKNEYVDGNLATAKGHKIQTAVVGAMQPGAALPCYDCHDSHGSVNNGLILDNNSIYNDCTSLLAITTYNQGARPYNDKIVCAGCHDTGNPTTLGTKAGGIATAVEGLYPVDPFDSTPTGAMHQSSGINTVLTASTMNCLSANGGCHASPHNPVGESKGGQNCKLCHSSIFTAMDNGTSTGYHHVMLADNAPIAGVYPTNATPTATSTDRTCLICHVDHDYFSKLVNGANTRAKNLRNDITVQPDNGANAPLRTDYDNNATRGGICTSCHLNAQTKRNPGTDIKSDGVGTTAVVSKALYGNSAHNYPGAAPFIQGHITSDNADAAAYFQANCSKCHNDTAGTSFQDGANKFALHSSDGANAVNNLLAPLGYTPLTDNLASNFCYRCHSKVGQLANGKPANGRDYYNVTSVSMDNAAESVYAQFTRTSRHPVNPADQTASKGVDCLNCHNVHATRSTTGGVAANPDNTYAYAAYNLGDNSAASVQNRALFCLACHDGTPPAQVVSAGQYVPLAVKVSSTIMNKATNGALPDGANSRGHWNISGSLQASTIKACDACHDKHGSTASRLLGVFDPADGLNKINGVVIPQTLFTSDNTTVCFACHTAPGLGAPTGNPTTGAGGSIMVFEGYRSAVAADNGYFNPTPSGSVTTPRWTGKTAYNSTSPHGTSGLSGPASLGGRPVPDCNGCHDPHGTSYKWNMLSDNMVAGNYKLCFDCHSAGGPAVYNNIGSYFPTNVGGLWAGTDNNHGHRIRTSGGKLGVGVALPCYDCHGIHGTRNGNSHSLSDQRWNGLGDTLTNDNASRVFCLGCHATSDLKDGYGNSLTGADMIEGLSRVAARPLLLPNTVPAHASGKSSGCKSCHYGSVAYLDNAANNAHNPGPGVGGPDIGQYFDRKIQTPGPTNYADNSSHPLIGLTDGTAGSLVFSGTPNCLGCHYASGPARTSDECLKCHFENTSGANGALGPQHMNKTIELATVSGNSLPSSAYTITTLAQYDAWCLQCHNTGSTTTLGGLSASAARGTVIPASDFANGRHRALGVGCIYCHQPHGRSNAHLIRENSWNRSQAGPTPMRFTVYPTDNLTASYPPATGSTWVGNAPANYRARQYWADNTAPYVAEADDDQAYCNQMCHSARTSATYMKDKIVSRDNTTGNFILNGAPAFRKVYFVNGLQYTIDNTNQYQHQHPNGEIIPTDNMVAYYAATSGVSGPSYYQYPMTTSALPTAYNPATSDLPFNPDYNGDAVRDFTNAYGVGGRITYRYTCTTCHNPHGTALPNQPGNDGFPDLRLLRANPSTLCVRCHK